MELKQYSTSIEYKYDGYITSYMARQLKLCLLDNPYIDNVLSMKFKQGINNSENNLFCISVLHHARSDKIIDSMINKLFMEIIALFGLMRI